MAVVSQDLSLKFFTVEALTVLLSPNVAYLLAEETLDVTMSAIIWRPEFIIRVTFSRTICAFALGFMQALEVNSYDDTSVRGRSAAIVSTFFINLSIDNEFLRNREWLDDDVCNINRG